MTYDLSATPAAELEVRIAQLQERLRQKEVQAALIVQKTDLYYFSGTSQQGWLYVPDTGEALLMVFKEFERAKQESQLVDVIPLVSPKKIPDQLQLMGLVLPSVLGMELDVLPVNLFSQYQKIFADAKIVDVSTEIRLVRAVKSSYEIDRIRKACALSDQVALRVPELLVEGKTEVQLAGEIEAYARSLGHQGIVRMRLWGSEMFYGHLMSGSSAAVPSYLASPTGGEGVSSMIGQGAGYKKIGRNEPVLVDYVFALNGYLSDHTRIFSLGQLPDELMQAHEAMLAIQEEVKKLAVPGVLTGDLYEQMIALAEKKGYGENFMGVGDRKIRFTGHGVGLELDEFPFIAKGQTLPLAAGMVIALEPKAIFPGKGVVGIENTHLVTEQGLESLTTLDNTIRII
ncbi:M24 family metallopeptidase [Desulfopila aestuarii]|uniref:Xaa-Pro aminopeptidase n=1 Tax=Desulfopila aestuarii DSM 18488 TaxID=1121416 RepID=A0A1M7YAG5_9BACT|nr:Xaa-Pro peptidase family protein [Desulfopila aestuarii]SHO49624.1 Xaa-Pro aminopeptidase [Desulfopila aestuarii DSM 18488]